MKISKTSALFSALTSASGSSEEILPYIKRFLTIHPYAGLYEVDDRPYQSKVADPKKRHFHPSSDCMKCARLLYFERMKPDKLESEVIEPRLQTIFKIGSALHAMIQAWFVEMSGLEGFPTCVENEQRIHDEDWNIGGYIDSVVKFPGSDDEIPIEIKTMNSYRFKSLSAPLPEHKMQVGCYIMEKNAPFGIVLYVNKDDGEMKEFRVEPLDMMNVLMKWSHVRHAVANGDPSPLGFGCKKGSREWERCPARGFCFRCS